MIAFAASTHPGLKRSHNEDCYQASPDQGLWLVADGVGGHSFGEIASSIVKNTVTEVHSGGEPLIDAVRQAHRAVLEEITQRDESLGMGSTVVALAMNGSEYDIAWVGDSRAYLWDGTELKQLTRDHTLVSDLVDQGVLSKAEASTHPERHVLTQSIGVFHDMDLKPGNLSGQLEDGQQVLLCSDGLTDELSDAVIAGQLGDHSSAQEQVDGLLNAALASGGHDNITVVIIGEASGADRPARPLARDDLETTQNIGHAVSHETPDRANYTRHFWIALGLIVVAALLLI